MKRRWLLIGLVVGAAALFDLVFIASIESWRNAEWLALILYSMVLSHGSLLAVWVALGGKATPWRLVGAVVATAAGLRALHSSDPHVEMVGPMAFLLVVLSAQMVVLSALLLIARLLGLELADDLRKVPAEESATQRQWVQFSLRSLLSWTAALAVLLATWHYLPTKLLLEVSHEPIILGAIIFSSVVIALGALWIALGARWPRVRIITLGVTATAAVATMCLAIESGALGEFVEFCFVQTTYLVGSLWLIRLAGYRLAWQRRIRL